MKKLLTAAVICCTLLYSCDSRDEKTDPITGDTSMAPADNTMMADSANMSMGQDTAMSAPAMSDADFVTKAAAGGMTEVKAGEMAAKMGSTADIKGIGKMMVTDHTKANNELKALASKNNMMVPAALPADKQAKLDDLAAKKGKDFDDAYIMFMKAEHDEAINLFTTESSGGQNADLKGFAGKTLPTLKMHKEHLESGKAM